VKSKGEPERQLELFDSCHFTFDASRLTNLWGLATGNGVSHAGAGGPEEGPCLVEPRDKLCTLPHFLPVGLGHSYVDEKPNS
jgi:hypothetical protein